MTEGNVIAFPGQTLQELDPRAVLGAAEDVGLECVLVLGSTLEGGPYIASSTGDVPELLWLIETFKHHLLAGDYSE